MAAKIGYKMFRIEINKKIKIKDGEHPDWSGQTYKISCIWEKF